MKLKELMDVCRYNEIRLYSEKTGRLVAKTVEGLSKYAEVEVSGSSVYCKIDAGREGTYARPYLFVYGRNSDIEKIKTSGTISATDAAGGDVRGA